MAYLSKKDKDILNYIEKFNVGLTIKQASMMFFPKNQYAYDYARIKLKKLHDRKHLKYFTNNLTNEYIYYTNRNPNAWLTHDTFAMNFYANLLYYGAKILKYERTPSWLNKTIISDAFVIYQFGDKTKAAFIECDVYHDEKESIAKYERLFETKELQDMYGNFPLLISMNKIEKNHYSNNFTIVNMDLNCTNFVEKVLSL